MLVSLTMGYGNHCPYLVLVVVLYNSTLG